MEIDKKRKLELLQFYSNQRDSQLKQLMTINGQGTFSAVAALAMLLLGALSLKNEVANFDINQWPIYLIFVGILALFIAAYVYSSSYNKRIKKFEELMDYPKELEDLDQNTFMIRPNVLGNYLVFIGILIILIGTFGVIFHIYH